MDYHDPILRIAASWMNSPMLRGITQRVGGAAVAAAAVVSALLLFRYLLSGT